MKFVRKFSLAILALLLAGFLLPERKVVPVVGASDHDWNKNSFWYEPWGSSGVHKGVDIFARKGTAAVSTTDMLILYTGQVGKGGNVVLGLGPKWRLHYFAHLEQIAESTGFYVSASETIGTVGDSGNAAGKQPHMHYSVVSLIPYLWKMDSSTQGWKKAFYQNPIEYLQTAQAHAP
ncbi:M23 family metallopeptidase [Microbulbifer aggregans]|uniref:M23 family metallopeptidase n=1 Tax=Microbulbifer aggregans TaxID=1769779 RepID=UPI001CFD997E|nr:M23 family metallopeptidase [Microbulbifer aggregans]